MLQQTTTAAVAPYFERFTARWPRVQDLAAADDGEIMAAWAGLGYYARARNLLACARAVAATGGEFPQTEAGLRALPGLGAYTAAAVAAIAFGQRAVVVDGNVERVVARLFAVAEPMPAAKRTLRALAGTITPHDRAGDFAQGMMDIGAGVCTPRNPRCDACPLAAPCRARAGGDPARLPVKAAKAPRPERKGRAWWITRIEAGGEEEVLLVRRPARGLLGGMAALPDDGWNARRDGHGEPPLAGPWSSCGSVSHVFTHFSLTLEVRVYSGGDSPNLGALDGEWWPVSRIAEAGLPTLFARAAQRALAAIGETD
jgi:A/G-specific adenine glycosylase